MKSSTSGLIKHAGVVDDLVGRPTRFLAGQAGRFAAETAARRIVASAYDRAYPGSSRFAAKIFDLPDIVKDNPRAVRIGAIAAPLALCAAWFALRSRRRRQEGKGDTKEASVHRGLRDIVLARVAGMRSEKRAYAAVPLVTSA